jgi:hypothetical protein
MDLASWFLRDLGVAGISPLNPRNHRWGWLSSEGLAALLSARCGAAIAPGAADLLPTPTGMPCEPCQAISCLPAFAMLRATLITGGGAGHIGLAPTG